MSDAQASGRKPARVEISRGLVAVNALGSAFTHLISIAVLLWVNHFLLNRLSPEDYAPLPIVTALFLLFQVLTSFLTGGVARYVTEAYAKADLRRVTEIVSSMLPLIAAVVLLFWLLGAALALNIGSLMNIAPGQVPHAERMLGLMVLTHGIVLLAAPFSVGLYVRQKFMWLNGIRLGEQLLRLALIVVLLFEVSVNVLWVVVATQTALLAAMAVTVLISRRLIPELRFRRDAVRLSVTRELSSFGGWMMLGNLIYRIRTSVDVILLNRLATAVDVNAFHVGRLPDRYLDGLLVTLSATVQPALVAMHAADRQESLRRAFLRGNRYYLWLVLAMAAPLFVFAEELVVLYAGEIYLLAALVLKLRCASYPFSHAVQMLALICMARARVRAYFLITSIGALFHIALAIVLVAGHGLGAAGVAWASFAVALALQLIFLWPMGLRMLDLSFTRFARETLLPGWLPAAGALAAGYGMKAAFAPAGWLPVLGGAAVCALTYAALAAALSREEDRRDFSLLLRRIGARLGLRPQVRLQSSG